MNKAELVAAVAAKVDLTKKDVDAVVGGLLEVIEESIVSGDKVTLVGFGTFEPRHRQGRMGRNPSTGEPISIPPARVPAFAPGKQFKSAVAAG
jgi:DNA-binding protein HU-beta